MEYRSFPQGYLVRLDPGEEVVASLSKLVEEKGRMDLPGRPISLCTTEAFLRTFGLATLEQLPPLHENDAVQLELTGAANETGA